MTRRTAAPLVLLAALTLVPANRARGEVVALEVIRREPFAGGMAFGETGPYERIVAVARFAVARPAAACKECRELVSASGR